MLHFVQHDKPGRRLVIVNETAVTQHHLWLLPSPARARRACPLPGRRLSIFSVFRRAMHASAQLFCSLGPQDRENRQPLDGERDLEMDTETEPKKSQTRRMTAYSIKLFTRHHTRAREASRADKESAKLRAGGGGYRNGRPLRPL